MVSTIPSGHGSLRLIMVASALYIPPDKRALSAGIASDLYAREVLGCLANGGTLHLNTKAKDESVMLPL
ncbi:uncharacterized protein B0H18DRAFT_969390 [Fomitopsis serialis]|uniref:uncharacterized protein n=1 Tax=Fomitopsis serialis TaxID=139415 RepID=UPI0020080132|nr:uncharacterized protein B0H18DRAFT_969390 [Neoantrodia serialis]KAH9937161.1 hypothetical protein B0H18DRAFT_969390 [Neoantrodia serialis]